jgi:hypothetical protein
MIVWIKSVWNIRGAETCLSTLPVMISRVDMLPHKESGVSGVITFSLFQLPKKVESVKGPPAENSVWLSLEVVRIRIGDEMFSRQPTRRVVMGVSERATFEYWDYFELPGSDDIEEIQVRPETVSVVEPKVQKGVLKEESIYLIILRSI